MPTPVLSPVIFISFNHSSGRRALISCSDKTGVSSLLLDLSGEITSHKSLPSTMLMFHILHSWKVLPDFSLWPEWKQKILGTLALASSPPMHMVPFLLVPFMVPVCCLFKCWLSALSWAFSKFTKWFSEPLSP